MKNIDRLQEIDKYVVITLRNWKKGSAQELEEYLKSEAAFLRSYNPYGTFGKPFTAQYDYMASAIEDLNLEAMETLYNSGVFNFDRRNKYDEVNYFCRMINRPGNPWNRKIKRGSRKDVFNFILQHNLSYLVLPDDKARKVGPLHPLREAVINGDEELAEMIIDADPKSVYVANRYDEDPLITATLRRDADMLRMFQRKGVDITQKTPSGYVPFYQALLMEHLKGGISEVPMYLFDAGTDINEPDLYSKTGAHYLCYCNSENLFDKMMLKIKDINIPNKSGDTPLHAVFRSYMDSDDDKINRIKKMLKAGADINAENIEKLNPIAAGFRAFDIDGLKKLYSYGLLDLNYTNSVGQNYGMMIMRHGRVEDIPEFLIFAAEHEFDFDATDHTGKGLLDYIPVDKKGRVLPGFAAVRETIKQIQKEKKEEEKLEDFSDIGF